MLGWFVKNAFCFSVKRCTSSRCRPIRDRILSRRDADAAAVERERCEARAAAAARREAEAEGGGEGGGGGAGGTSKWGSVRAHVTVSAALASGGKEHRRKKIDAEEEFRKEMVSVALTYLSTLLLHSRT